MSLQNRLIEGGYLSAQATGYYGQATVAAVKAYQKANGIEPLGYVGPATRAALNKSVDALRANLLQQLQILLQQIKEMQAQAGTTTI
jgi:peptidoglycan hydrolase-like protein with peptidoglycan-binding domain